MEKILRILMINTLLSMKNRRIIGRMTVIKKKKNNNNNSLCHCVVIIRINKIKTMSLRRINGKHKVINKILIIQKVNCLIISISK